VPKRPARDNDLARVPDMLHAAQLTSLLNLAARLTNKAARHRMGDFGAWPGQIPVLLWLLQEDGIIQRDLVQRVNMEQSTVAEHLERMERNGLIVRRPDEADRRSVRIYLTRRARDLSGDLLWQLETGARLFTKGVLRHDLDVFTRVLRRIIENLDDFLDAPPPVPPVTRRR
jgi:DNA-binding MarR family transcriptional regulator